MKTSKEIWENSWSKGNRMNSASTLLGGATTMFGAAKSNAEIADTSGIDAFNEGVKNTTYSYGSFDNLDSEFDTKSLARTNYTGKELRGVTPGQMALNTLSSVGSGISTGAKLGGLWGGVFGGLTGLATGLVTIGIGNNEASIEAGRVNKEGTNSNNYNLGSYNNSIRNTKNMTFRNSISAYGGPLFNHSENFDNGITFINAGGTHEENPLGGVPVGVDQNGTPNLVEEGEVIWNDYVFSNRLKPTKKQLEEAGYKNKYEGLPFSKVAEKIQQGAAERVNDQIAIDSMNDALSQLAQMQEMIRTKKENKMNVFDSGGPTNMSKREIRKSARQLHRLLQGTPVEIGANIYREKGVVTPLYKEYLDSILNNIKLDDIQIEDPVIDLEDTPFTSLPTFVSEDEARALAEEEAYFNSKSNELANEIMKDVPSIKEAYTDKLLEEALNIGKERSVFTPKVNNKYFGRDIPTIANGLALLHNMFEQPDFEEAEAIEKGARNIQRGNVTHIGDYLDLPDVDTNAITNTLLASSAANLRANQNLGLNASQVAGLNLTSNYKANRAVGDALLQGKLTQGDIALKEMTHNSGVNRFNSEMDYRGLGLNQRADEITYQGIVSGAQLRAAEKEMQDKAITQSLDNFIGGIGDRVTENYWKNVINSLPYNYKLGNDGTVTFGKNGGCLTRRRRRR